MNLKTRLVGVFVLAALAVSTRAETFIVKDGKPNAEIVIAENAKRMAALGALELRYYLDKMTGAKLPIVTKPDDKYPVKIYVGESDYAKKLGVTAEGLKYEAFRMVSGKDWLALVGEDYDFEPYKPFIQKPSDKERAMAEWDKMVAEKGNGGGPWMMPFILQYKEWWNPVTRAKPPAKPTQGGTEVEGYDAIMAKRYGEDTKHVWNPRSLKYSRSYQGPGAGAGFWYSDRGGSLNAVCEFLRSLGVRWYMPHELGEVVPELKSVTLPKVNKTVRPDFDVRSWTLYNFNGPFFHDGIWVKHLGINTGNAKLGFAKSAHFTGHPRVYNRQKEEHPEFFAIIGGKRHIDSRNSMACYSSKELEEETIKNIRFMYDELDAPCVSIWPADGFQKCECELCTPQTPSEVVWGFVDRVARELYKTHPDRMVLCGAYTSYALPPETIKKLSPNVLVFMANRGRPQFDHEETWKNYWKQVEGWKSRTAPGRLIRGDNNRYGLKGSAGNGKPDFPVIHPRAMAKDLKALKGISIGERGEVSQSSARWAAPGCDHLTLYVQSRFLWDADQDVEKILDEYYKLFYGPAEKEAREAIEFAMANYNRLFAPQEVSLEKRVEFLEKLYAAHEKAGDTIYGKRLRIMMDELPPLEESREELKRKIAAGDPRENNPLVTIVDGEPSDVYHLVHIKSGEKADVDTSFTVTWDKDAFVFDITCQEPNMKDLKSTQMVWNGDSVAILLESPRHSYYQIEISPDGVVFDADRLYGKLTKQWTARARVETEKGNDFWRVKARIPVLPPEKNQGDPWHYVVGPKPSKDNVWYFNVGRSRQAAGSHGKHGAGTGYLFNPSGPKGRGYHEVEKFAKLIVDQPKPEKK